MSTRTARSPAVTIPVALGLTLAFALAVSTGAGQAHAVPGDPYADDFLGVAESHSIIASATITNLGPSVISNDVALHPAAGTFLTGFPPGVINGTVNTGTTGDAAAALAARNALNTAYIGAASAGSTAPIVADLGGQTLTPGVYTTASGIGLTGTLTLNGGPDDLFIFQAGSTLTVATDSYVELIGGAQWCNVYWQVGSSASLLGGTASPVFVGTILAATSISTVSGTYVRGRLLASALNDGAVTLDNTVIDSTGSCAAGSGGGGPGSDLGELPFTGSGDSWVGLGIGSLAVLTGFLALFVARRSGRRAKNEEFRPLGGE